MISKIRRSKVTDYAALSDHYGVFCNRKSQSNISKNIHQVITYRSFRNFEENRFLNNLYSVPWKIIEQFDNLDDIVSSWSPAGKGLTSWLSFVVSSVSLSLSHWYPGSGVVLDCIDS